MRTKSMQALVQEASTLAQKLIRLRASDDNGYCSCFTCGVVRNWRAMHGGHYISRTHWRHRLDLNLMRPQCYQCNVTMRGRFRKFRQLLVDELGENRVQAIDDTKRDDPPWDADDLVIMIAEFKAAIKQELKRVL